MSERIPESELHSVLASFEGQLESPVVPGELPEWLKNTEQLTEKLISTMDVHFENRHNNLLEEIVEQAPGMLTRVDQLKEEDRKLKEEADRILQLVSSMDEHSSTLEPDEGRARRVMETIIHEGLEFVIRFRKHESAIEAWVVEAFERDRGVAD